MKWILGLLVPVFCLGRLYAGDTERDELMWAMAYDGNYSMTHKMALSRPCKNINDEIMFHFVMAYVTYRKSGMDEVQFSFQGIDAFLEHKFSSNKK